jgi:hypothetical protein
MAQIKNSICVIRVIRGYLLFAADLELMPGRNLVNSRAFVKV